MTSIKSVLKSTGWYLISWFFLPIIFVFFYVTKYRNPVHAALEHLWVIFLFASVFILFKWLLHSLLSKKNDAIIAYSFCLASFNYLTIFYYGLVIIGLESWGRVITTELFLSYFSHAKQFCESIEISFFLVVFVLLLLYGLLAYLTLLFCQKTCTNQNLPTLKIHRGLLAGLILALFCFAAYHLMTRLLSADYDSTEPINLTLYSGKDIFEERFFPRAYPYKEQLDKLEQSAISGYAPNHQATKKHVILIVVDALRLNRMSAYGSKRRTTPFIDSLIQSGKLTKIDRFVSSCPETGCALNSLLAARHPHQNPKNPFNLILAFKKHGYQTKLFLGGDHTNFYGLKRFYGDVDEYYDGVDEKKYFFNDDELVLKKVEALPTSGEQPLYLQLHLMSAHTLGLHHDNYKNFLPSKSYTGNVTGKPELQFINHYDNGVIQMDSYLKTIYAELETKGYLKNAILVITADHGELLGEHGFYSHARGVWEDLLHVPLLVSGFSENTINQLNNTPLFAQYDLAPTVLNDLQIPIPKSWVGKPVQTQENQRYAYFKWPPYAGLYDYSDKNKIWKYWVNYNTGEESIFEMLSDQKEEDNLVWQPSLKVKKQTWAKETLRAHHLASPYIAETKPQ